jgi:16S rRNA (adenine1518-N6/adenine1519-N6)-dimethyltransferase
LSIARVLDLHAASSSSRFRRQKYGQHMLASSETAKKLVQFCHLSSGIRVLEIGTGTGALTRVLADNVSYVDSYEIDRQLFTDAKESLSNFKNVNLVLGDVFSSDVRTDKFDACITSLPYSESLRFLKWLATWPNPFEVAAAIVQSEFADKLISPPERRTYRAASVIAQISFRVEFLFDIGRDEFYPPPRVGSRAIKLQPNPEFSLPFFNQRRLRILDYIFSFRGRKFSSVLKKFYPEKKSPFFPEEFVSRRIEAISPRDYAKIIPELEVSFNW